MSKLDHPGPAIERHQPEARHCVICDKVFIPKRTNQITCTKVCRERARVLGTRIALTDRRCAWCGKRLKSNNPKARFCDGSCRISAFKAKPCIYCGAAADTRDHFVPKAFASRVEDFASIKKRNLLVPACRECNSTAGAEVFNTIKEKRLYIRDHYLKRYKKLLASPHWTDAEINELGFGLQSHVKRTEAERRFIVERLQRLNRGGEGLSIKRQKPPLENAIDKLIYQLSQ